MRVSGTYAHHVMMQKFIMSLTVCSVCVCIYRNMHAVSYVSDNIDHWSVVLCTAIFLEAIKVASLLHPRIDSRVASIISATCVILSSCYVFEARSQKYQIEYTEKMNQFNAYNQKRLHVIALNDALRQSNKNEQMIADAHSATIRALQKSIEESAPSLGRSQIEKIAKSAAKIEESMTDVRTKTLQEVPPEIRAPIQRGWVMGAFLWSSVFAALEFMTIYLIRAVAPKTQPQNDTYEHIKNEIRDKNLAGTVREIQRIARCSQNVALRYAAQLRDDGVIEDRRKRKSHLKVVNP